MKPNIIRLAPALLAAAIATARGSEEPPERRPPPIPPLFAFFDADHDGVLSSGEIATAAEALGQLDQNGDGEITQDEMRPPKPAAPPAGKRPPPPVIAALDTDKDGTLSAEELEAAPESLKQLDTDGDGELAPEELHPHGPPPPTEEAQDDAAPPPQGDDGEPVEIE